MFDSITSEDLIKGAPILITAGVVSFVVIKSLLCKNEDRCCNKMIKKNQAKVVCSFDIEDLPDKVAFCRCWQSKKFPYCDGSHNAHNKATGDNLGPLCLARKEPSKESSA